MLTTQRHATSQASVLNSLQWPLGCFIDCAETDHETRTAHGDKNELKASDLLFNDNRDSFCDCIVGGAGED